MDKKNFPVHLCWEATFSKKSLLLSVRHVLNVLRRVTQGFVMFIIFGCDHQVTPRHQSFMMCISSFCDCRCGEWGGICNCDVVIVCDLHGVGNVFLFLAF